MIKQTTKYILFLFLLSVFFSSCSFLLDFASHYDDCSYPGCERKARKGSSYCSHHDGNLTKNSIDNSLRNIGNQNKRNR